MSGIKANVRDNVLNEVVAEHELAGFRSTTIIDVSASGNPAGPKPSTYSMECA